VDTISKNKIIPKLKTFRIFAEVQSVTAFVQMAQNEMREVKKNELIGEKRFGYWKINRK